MKGEILEMKYITKVRKTFPLIYNIMNIVAANFSANGLIAIGASPSISNNPKEAEEMAAKADALVLNLGTLSEENTEAMILAGKAANEAGVPVLLDPIPVAATTFRTKVIDDILSTVELSAICANAGEISVLVGVFEKTPSPHKALEQNDPANANEVAKRYNTVVSATGGTDVIKDGDSTYLCQHRHPMWQSIPASGCVLKSVIAAFINVPEGHHFE